MSAKKFSRSTYSLYLGLAASSCLLSSIAAADFPGGVLEQADAGTTRPVMSQSEIAGLLPERGSFTFPAPYNTTGIRLTNASDCGGADCVNDLGYSYWRNINNHVGAETMYVFVGLDQQGPTLIEYNKTTEQVTNTGPVFPASSPYSGTSGEGFYFSASMPTKMYVFSNSLIERFDVVSKQLETVMDVNAHLGAGHTLWQAHSSDDDTVHSATVRNADYQPLGCMTYQEDISKFTYYPAQGEYDECQIDRSGDWLVIKEDVDGVDGEDNRIIGVHTGEERVLLDRDGAGGHSDLGHGYMVASDNWADIANTTRVWNFNANPMTGPVVYANNDWNVAAPTHLSHTNARPDVPMEQQVACGSSANAANSPGANEIVCFRLDGSKETLVVAPVMTDVNGGKGDSYNKMPKGNLDVTGEYFVWTSNMGGTRTDAFLVKVPSHLLTGDRASLPAPAVSAAGTIAHAAELKLPLRSSTTASGAATSAVIHAGVLKNGQAADTVTLPETVALDARIQPEAGHVGQPAQIVLVMRNVADGSFSSADASGQQIAMVPGSSPATYRTIDALQGSNAVNLFSGTPGEQFRGSYEIFVGYRLHAEGEIYFNADPVALTVQ